MAAFDEVQQVLVEVSNEIRTNGGLVNAKVEFVQSENEGFGVFASGDIAHGETLIKVPFSMCISVEKILEFAGLKQVFVDNEGLLNYPDEVIAIALMHGKLFPESTCSWAKHTKMLPMEFNTTIFWSDEELDELKGNNVFHLTKMMKRQIDMDYTSIHLPLSEAYPELLGGITKDLYTWALSIVYSRCLDITRGDKDVRCVVPVLDMANHNPHSGALPSDTFKYDDESDCVCLVAAADLKAGDECYAVYGMYPNSKLLYTYGFVVLNNPTMAIDQWVRLPQGCYGYDTKNEFLNNQPLTREQAYDFKGTLRPGYVAPALLAAIRVIQADDEELPRLSNAVEGKLLSVRNEQATYVSLRNLIIARMDVERAQADVTKLGELLLNDTPFGDRLRCALIVRVEERRLLESVLALVNRWISEIEVQGEAYLPPDAPRVNAEK
eukprot:gene16881-19240_t